MVVNFAFDYLVIFVFDESSGKVRTPEVLVEVPEIKLYHVEHPRGFRYSITAVVD